MKNIYEITSVDRTEVLIVDLFLLGVSMAMIPFFVYRPGRAVLTTLGVRVSFDTKTFFSARFSQKNQQKWFTIAQISIFFQFL